MAVAAAPPPEGRLPGMAGGRRGIRAEALEPPLAFPLPPEPRGRAGGRLRSRGLCRRGQCRSRGTAKGTGHPHGPARDPHSRAPRDRRAGRGIPEAGRPGQRALRGLGLVPRGRAALPRRAPSPSTHRVKQEQVCSQMPLTTPSPAAPSAASSSAHPLRAKQSQIKVLLLPFPTPVAAPPPGAEPGPLFTCPGAGRGGGEVGPPSGDFRSPWPPASPPPVPPTLTPGPVAGTLAGVGGGSFLAWELGSGLPSLLPLALILANQTSGRVYKAGGQ